MISYTPHRDELRRLLIGRQPLVILPGAHPTYIWRLLEELLAQGGITDARQLVPGVGSWRLSAEGPPIPGPSRGELGLEGWLARDLRERLGETRGERPQVLWLLAPFEAVQGSSAALAAWCQRVQREGLPDRLLVTTEGEPGALLAPFARIAALDLPRDHGGGIQLRDYLSTCLHELGFSELSRDLSVLRSYTRLLQGLPAHDIFGALRDACRPDAAREAIEEGLKERRHELMRVSSGLEIVTTTLQRDDVGGMDELKDHLDHIGCVLEDPRAAEEAGVAPPRGLMLIGMPGCGKSLAAELAASILDVPLLRLDMGGLMGGLLGQSEANLRKALAASVAAAPCILWIDEIEKAFGGLAGGNEGGTGRRMLGSILTWMQEQQKSGVFVFATANKIDGLPPELLRRGRFDELYKVDLPTEAGRAEILRIHLRKAKIELHEQLTAKDVEQLAKNLKDYTGADIEALVRDANLQRFAAAESVLTRKALEKVQSGMRSLAEQFKDEIKPMREELQRRGFKDVNRDPGKEASRQKLRRGTRAPLPDALERLRSGGRSQWHVGEGEEGWTIQFGGMLDQEGKVDYDRVRVCAGTSDTMLKSVSLRIQKGYQESAGKPHLEIALPSGEAPIEHQVATIFRSPENNEKGVLALLREEPSGVGIVCGWVAPGGRGAQNRPLRASRPGFVRIEPGSFQMGSPDGRGISIWPFRSAENGRSEDEMPHTVKLTRAFWLKSTPVTQGEWQALMGNNPSRFSQVGSQAPVEMVSWYDALAYANRLSEQEGLVPFYDLQEAQHKPGSGGFRVERVVVKDRQGLGYRLPTEAEWEYACRAGTSGATWRGELTQVDGRDPVLEKIAWYKENSGGATWPVGQKEANPWGLYDMLGNVWEWVWDVYAPYAGDAVDPWIEGGSKRVLRGCSWNGFARRCRAADRGGNAPGVRDDRVGFRLARSCP